MPEIFLDMAIEDLLKIEKPNSIAHERLIGILEIIHRGSLPSASDLEYVRQRQSREKPDCEYLLNGIGCKKGVASVCPAAKKWKHGLIGCAFYLALQPLNKSNPKPFEPVDADKRRM